MVDPRRGMTYLRLMRPSLAETLQSAAAGFQAGDRSLVVGVLVAVAHADLDIDDAEREAIRAALSAALGAAVSDDDLSADIARGRSRMAASGGIRFAEQMGKNLAEAGRVEAGLRLAKAIAEASDGISEAEASRLEALERGGGLALSPHRRVAAQ